MDQARPTRKLLDWKPMGIRPVGRPRQRWQEDVMENLKKLKVKNWKETVKDRSTWTQKAKTDKGLLCQMMMMMMMMISNKMQRYTVYFIWKLLYMFRVVPPPIIRSAKICIYSIWYLSDRYCYLPIAAGSSNGLTNTRCCRYKFLRS